MGNEVFLAFRWADVEFTARFEPNIHPRIGDRLGFAFITEKLHLFDGASGERLA